MCGWQPITAVLPNFLPVNAQCPFRPKPNEKFPCTEIVDDKNRLVTGAYAGNADWVAKEMDKQCRIYLLFNH